MHSFHCTWILSDNCQWWVLSNKCPGYMAPLGKQQILQLQWPQSPLRMSDFPSLQIPIHVSSRPCSWARYLVVMANVCKVDEWIYCDCHSEAVGFPRQCRKVLPRHSQSMQVLLCHVKLCKSRRRARHKALVKASCHKMLQSCALTSPTRL